MAAAVRPRCWKLRTSTFPRAASTSLRSMVAVCEVGRRAEAFEADTIRKLASSPSFGISGANLASSSGRAPYSKCLDPEVANTGITAAATSALPPSLPPSAPASPRPSPSSLRLRSLASPPSSYANLRVSTASASTAPLAPLAGPTS